MNISLQRGKYKTKINLVIILTEKWQKCGRKIWTLTHGSTLEKQVVFLHFNFMQFSYCADVLKTKAHKFFRFG